MKDIITFKGRKYCLSGRYYRRYNWGKKGPSNLHRAIWEHFRGPIPRGLHIHHRNGDGVDNRLANLVLIEGSGHLRKHATERHANGMMLPPGKLARQRAAEWHGSAEGLEWHRRQAKERKRTEIWHPHICKECGREFRTARPSNAKFCHQNCRSAAFRKRGGHSNGTRPYRKKIPALQGKRRPR